MTSQTKSNRHGLGIKDTNPCPPYLLHYACSTYSEKWQHCLLLPVTRVHSIVRKHSVAFTTLLRAQCRHCAANNKSQSGLRHQHGEGWRKGALHHLSKEYAAHNSPACQLSESAPSRNTSNSQMQIATELEHLVNTARPEKTGILEDYCSIVL